LSIVLTIVNIDGNLDSRETLQMTPEQEALIDNLLTAGQRLIAAQAAFDRCLAAEGTPALKDVAGSYQRALNEAMDAHTALVQAGAPQPTETCPDCRYPATLCPHCSNPLCNCHTSKSCNREVPQ
jgi:hypothetical protein